MTEIGEKEKMRTKLLATLVVLVLACGFLATSTNIRPVEAVEPPYYLTITSSPYPSIPTEPAVGKYKYDNTAWQNCTAPLEYIVGTTKYIFKNWTVTPITDDFSVATGQIWVHMDGVYQNKTATAYYTKQYLVTLSPNPFTAQGVTDWIWSAATGWVNTNSMWVAEGAQAEVGVEGLSGSPPGVYVNPNVWAYLVDFGGDASGYTDWGWIWTSNPFNVNSPKTAVSNWNFMYTLYVYSTPNPPVPNPPGTNWYYKGTVVSLNAADYFVNWAYRYTLVTWKVDGATASGNPISVTMNTNHTAIAYYKPQIFVYLDDDIANKSGIKDMGKWYDVGPIQTFTAPSPVPLDSLHRYEFIYWSKVGSGYTNSSNPFKVIFDATWAGYTLRAVYHMHYFLGVFSSPSSLPGFLYPDSDTTGWPAAGSTVNLKAKPIVNISPTKRYKFVQWKNHLGGTNPNNNITFPMMQPWNVTAEYNLEWLATWDYSPTSLTIPGWPGQAWIIDGTPVSYTAPGTDLSGNFVFYYWKINGVTYASGLNPVDLGTMTGPIAGTAYYANKTKIFMDPPSHTETAPAYCHEFDVKVYASNFDANRKDANGYPFDIYGFDFVIAWNPSLLELKSVVLNLDAFFAPNSYFVGINKIDNVAGTYHLVATVKGNFTGFTGTKAMFTMRFHVIYDPCYPNIASTAVYFTTLILSNHLGQSIWPELGYTNAGYTISALQPMLDIKSRSDGTHVVTVHKNEPQSFFDVDVFLLNGVKVHDFYVEVNFNPAQIQADSVVIANYLKPPYVTYAWWYNNAIGRVYVSVAQDSSVPLQNGTGLLFTIKFKAIAAIYYKTGGPWVLSSLITINYAYLSCFCPNSYYQETTTGALGFTAATYVYNPLPGDLNFDGVVNVLDLQLVVDNWCTGNYDVVTDGHTDLWDLVFVALRFGNHV